MIVYHIAITAAADYATRREAYRRSHIERLQGLRAAGILICGGPPPDGKTADIFYRLQQPGSSKTRSRRDPTGRAAAGPASSPPASPSSSSPGGGFPSSSTAP